MIMKKEDIKKILTENKEQIKKYKLISIALFGSFVKNEESEESDIDILVEFDNSMFDENFTGYSDNYIELLSFLEQILGRKVDLLTNDMISPYIKPYILREVEYIETRD